VNLRSPYRGLAAFDDSALDALYFFGRERDSEIVVANLIASRLTVLYGPSGVGKSSLLHASVARSLRRLPEAPLVVVFSTWSDPPEPALAHAIAEAAGLAPGPLAEVAERAQTERDVYLVLDQAEEYFTYHAGDDGFDTALAALVDGPLRVNVLLSLREDTLASLDRLKAAIPSLFGNVLRLERLDRDAGRAAIVRPLERWGELEGEAVTIDDDLVGAVLDGVGEGQIELGPGGQAVPDANGRPPGIEAPYLQLVMQRLWDVERSGGSSTLRAETLAGLGGAGQVVADHLERAVEALTPVQRDIASRLFEHLVTPSGTKIAHETSDLAQFAQSSAGEVRGVTDVLSDHRILRTDESGRWEIFHDVLAAAVLGWKSRYDAERAVERARAEAQRRHRRLAFLAVGALAGLVFMGVLAGWAVVERNHARQRALEARAHELEARAVTQMPRDTTLALMLAAEAARTAPSAAAEDVLRRALTVDRLLYVVPVGGAVTEVASGAPDAFFVASADGHARRYAGADSDRRHPFVDLEAGYRSRVTVVAPDPAGMLSASSDGTARRTVDPSLASSVAPLALHHATPVAAIARVGCRTGPGCLVIAAGARLWVWDGRDGRRVGSIRMSTRVADLVPWSPTQLAVRTADGRVHVVDVTAQRIARDLPTRDRVDSIASDATHDLVAAGLADGGVLVWNTVSGRPVTRYEPHLGSVLALDVANGIVLSGAADGAAAVRNLATGRTIPLPGGHGNVVRSARLSSDGRYAVTASSDHTAKVWATADGRLVSLLAGHSDVVTDAVFVDAAERVVTGSLDGTARVWASGAKPELEARDVEAPAKPTRIAESADGARAEADAEVIRLRTAAGKVLVLRGHRDVVNSVAFDPSGSLLVSSSRDHDARIWDARSGRLLQHLVGHFGSVADARFSPDGRWVVTAGPITAGLWSVRTGELVMYLRGPTSRPAAVAFAPDSRTIVVGEANGTVRRYQCAVCGDLDELLALADRRLGRSGLARTRMDEQTGTTRGA
jgi:WD40 repeat protein